MLKNLPIEIYDGSLDVSKIFDTWYKKYKLENCGAFITFTGIVREEGGIESLSFDIYEPILQSWFDSWQEKLKDYNGFALFAHSKGDVLVHECSYISAVVTPQRKAGLKLINDFVEDFKANAPIWKYDIIDGKRIYAKDRSKELKGAGILSDK